jgi:phosphoribosyl 1,2-cyclic phosphodiesterase
MAMSSDNVAPRFTVRFWGVRGSIPSPGPHTARFGGNTSCVSVEGRYADGTETVGVLDAGTGIRALGDLLARDYREILLLLTHTHWDHIQGFPFFAPLRQPGRRIYLSRAERERGLFQMLLDQVDGVRFPLTLEAAGAQFLSYTDEKIREQESLGYRLRRIRVNHPGEAFAFRAELAGTSLIYAPDNELFPPGEPHTPFAEMADFCRGADLLIHDSQYTDADLPEKHGWGHSTAAQARELAAAAGVGHLVLFHHDPDRTDDALDALQAESDAWFAAHAPAVRCTVAREGLTLTLPEAPGVK